MNKLQSNQASWLLIAALAFWAATDKAAGQSRRASSAQTFEVAGNVGRKGTAERAAKIGDPGPARRSLTPAIDLSILGLSRDARLHATAGNSGRATAARRGAQLSATDLLKRKLYAQLQAELPGRGDDILIGDLKLPMKINFPDGPWDVDFHFRMPRNGVGRIVYTGIISQNGRPRQRLTGSLSLDRKARGVQVRRLIRRGEIIKPGDLVALETSLSRLPADTFSSVENLAGAAARSELRPGAWLTGRMIESPTIIKRNQVVTMKLERGALHISCKVIAKQKGRTGDIIRVQNIQTGREVPARIISRELVEPIY